MKESDASNFFMKRGKRAVKSRDELNGETVWRVFMECWDLFIAPFIFGTLKFFHILESVINTPESMVLSQSVLLNFPL